ncbi:MAG: adenosylmethionine decarboxylase [Archangium sp.]|nr:adenosylmethionine decarboxylase [Archangium sp.]
MTSQTEPLAKHVHLELWGVNEDVLNDPQRLEQILKNAAAAARCEVLGSVAHQFQPQGASVVVLVAESHLSIHTWPERQYAAADILTCGNTLPEAGVRSIVAELLPASWSTEIYNRGVTPLKK